MTRRESIGVLTAASMSAATKIPDAIVRRTDEAIDRYLKIQVTNPKNRWYGGIPDAYGLHAPGSAIGLWGIFTAGYIHPESRHFKNKALIDGIRLSADFIQRSLSAEGNIYLPVTNFNSPPDTAFAVRSSAETVLIARQAKAQEILKIIEPLVKRMSDSLVTGGIHTPNHRWVLCAALAQANELWPDPRYIRRIDQWLAEGIDMDSDGQWSERSAGGYNAICNSAFIIMAEKLKRPELLDPVLRNMESMLYLLHPNGEVETGFSRRQDLNIQVTMAPYWFSLQYLAAVKNDRRFGQLAKENFESSASLSTLIANPAMNRTDYAADPLPSNYLKEFPHNHVVRIRRGLASATLETEGRDRFFSIRHGDAVVQAVRFATAFFGKAQFVPQKHSKDGNAYVLTQYLEGPYYQPFTPTRKINADEWDETQKQRPRTEICKLTQSAKIQEIRNGIQVEVSAEGTDNVPLTIELNLREGTKVEGATGKLLTAEKVTFSGASQKLYLKGGGSEHNYTEVRGARPNLPGQSVFITGYTPFKRVLEFTWG